jgi:hypothetical protein
MGNCGRVPWLSRKGQQLPLAIVTSALMRDDLNWSCLVKSAMMGPWPKIRGPRHRTPKLTQILQRLILRRKTLGSIK